MENQQSEKLLDIIRSYGKAMYEAGYASDNSDFKIVAENDAERHWTILEEIIKTNYIPKPKEDKSELPINLTEQYVKATQVGINEVNKALGLK